MTQQPPDSDSAELARALLECPLQEAKTEQERARAERFRPVAYGIGRYLIGDRYADALGYPRTPWRFAAPALRRWSPPPDGWRDGFREWTG